MWYGEISTLAESTTYDRYTIWLGCKLNKVQLRNMTTFEEAESGSEGSWWLEP